MNIRYKNETFNALEFYEELLNGSEATEQSMGRKTGELQEYVASNFMKVDTINKIKVNLVLNYVKPSNS